MICIGWVIRVSIVYNTRVSIDAVSAASDTHIVHGIRAGEKESKKLICEKLTNEWKPKSFLFFKISFLMPWRWKYDHTNHNFKLRDSLLQISLMASHTCIHPYTQIQISLNLLPWCKGWTHDLLGSPLKHYQLTYILRVQ